MSSNDAPTKANKHASTPYKVQQLRKPFKQHSTLKSQDPKLELPTNGMLNPAPSNPAAVQND